MPLKKDTQPKQKYIYVAVHTLKEYITQLVEAVEYTDFFSAERKDPLPNECPAYDTKQSDGEAPVMLELLGMRSIPSLPSHPGTLRPSVVTLDTVLSMGQTELNCIGWDGVVFSFKLHTSAKQNCLK